MPRRKIATTSWPAAASSLMNHEPVKELPPVKRIFIELIESALTAFRRGHDHASN
jgi:hypothetical protein